MRKIFKVILIIDVFLIAATGLIIYTGCYLDKDGKISRLIDEKQRLVFKVYNTTDMLFAPDDTVGTYSTKSSVVNLPGVNITIVDIPPDASDIRDILNLHYSVALGFLPGVNATVVNKALYNGHKTFYKVTIQPGGIDLSRGERQNVDVVNRALANGDYDGVYMSLDDTKILDRYPALSKKIRDAVSFVTVNDTVCYKSHICYIGSDVSSEEVGAILRKVSLMSEVDGTWTVVFVYSPDISAKISEAMANVALRDER